MDCIQLSLFGKTYPEHSVPTEEKISEPCWENLPTWNSQTFQFLDLRRGEDGAKPEQSSETDGLWLGDSSMLNTGEKPSMTAVQEMCSAWGPHSAAKESLLSQILEDNVPEKYYLSARACQGILMRASRRGKKLTDLLQTALLEMIEWWEPGVAAKAMEMLIAEEKKRIRREKLTALNERKERIREKAEKQLHTLLKSALAVPEEERAHLCKQKKSGRYRRSKTRRFSKRFPS